MRFISAITALAILMAVVLSPVGLSFASGSDGRASLVTLDVCTKHGASALAKIIAIDECMPQSAQMPITKPTQTYVHIIDRTSPSPLLSRDITKPPQLIS